MTPTITLWDDCALKATKKRVSGPYATSILDRVPNPSSHA